MAALVYGTNVIPQWFGAAPDKSALYDYKDVNSGDTINLAQDFIVILFAVVIDIKAQITGVCGISGTTLSFPGGLSVDMGLLLVSGE
jgi:hypothetical protein